MKSKSTTLHCGDSAEVLKQYPDNYFHSVGSFLSTLEDNTSTLYFHEIELFHTRYTKRSDGCWEWNHTRDGKGYGIFKTIRRWNNERAPRIALEIVGKKPRNSKEFACHTCDNKWCVNPDHLYLGDNRQDQIDARYRGQLGDLTNKRKQKIQSLSVQEWQEWLKKFEGKSGKALANMNTAIKWRNETK